MKTGRIPAMVAARAGGAGRAKQAGRTGGAGRAGRVAMLAGGVVGVVLVLGPVPARGAETVIASNGGIPLWKQRHDYRAQVDNLATELKYGTTTLKYKDLPSTEYNVRWPYDQDVRNPKLEPWLIAKAVGDIKDSVAFVNSEYYTDVDGDNGLAGGAYRCSPTAYGMVHEWMRATKLKSLKDFGGEQKTIEAFAYEADTDDINPAGPTAARQNDGVISVGTSRADGLTAANKILRESDAAYAREGGPKLKAFEWSVAGYKKAIDAGVPMVISYDNKDNKTGHAVVGVGYDGDKAIVKDPWTGEQLKKPFAELLKAGAHWADNLGGMGGPSRTGFDQEWDGVGMGLLTLPDYGDAPSTYELSVARQARHRDHFAQWLGSGVSGEVDPFSGRDDEDGIANVGDHDSGDDGASFRWNADGTGFADIRVTARDWVREADVEIDGPDGYGHAAADANMYLSVWADPEHTGSWDAAQQLVAGLVVGQITENGTGELTQYLVGNIAMPASGDGSLYWVRVRLSRQLGLGAYGESEYGEVEDYLIPAPGVLTLMGLAAGIPLRRRRAK